MPTLLTSFVGLSGISHGVSSFFSYKSYINLLPSSILSDPYHLIFQFTLRSNEILKGCRAYLRNICGVPTEWLQVGRIPVESPINSSQINMKITKYSGKTDGLNC